MADVVVSEEVALGEGCGQRWAEIRWVRTCLVMPDGDGNGCREMLDSAQLDLAAVLEHLRFHFWEAFQSHSPVWLFGEPVVDIAGQKSGKHLVEGKPAGVSIQDLGA
jgi:hypothetical protein